MPMMARDTRFAPRIRPAVREQPAGAAQEPTPHSAHSHTRGACPCGCPACAAKSPSKGQELNKEIRSHFESALGADLGGVRIHTDSDSARAVASDRESPDRDSPGGESNVR